MKLQTFLVKVITKVQSLCFYSKPEQAELRKIYTTKLKILVKTVLWKPVLPEKINIVDSFAKQICCTLC